MSSLYHSLTNEVFLPGCIFISTIFKSTYLRIKFELIKRVLSWSTEIQILQKLSANRSKKSNYVTPTDSIAVTRGDSLARSTDQSPPTESMGPGVFSSSLVTWLFEWLFSGNIAEKSAKLLLQSISGFQLNRESTELNMSFYHIERACELHGTKMTRHGLLHQGLTSAD